MKQISYKFWYITRDDSTGFITEAAVRFYEGEDMEVETENPMTEEKKKDICYVIVKRLEPKDIPELDGAFRQETNGSLARVYTSNDFGQIKTDDELRLFVNKEMSKHKGREPQKDQAEVHDIKKVK